MPINTSSTFSYDKLDHTKENSGHLMVSLEAPERDFERTPLCAALVLDISSSMGSAMTDGKKSKIAGLQQVARQIVQQLSSQDEVALIAYSSTSEVVMQRIKVENKDQIYAIIDKLHIQGCTNFGAGLIDGFRQINNDFSGVKRVFLVSDGQNNTGMSNEEVKELVNNRREYGKDITVSTFGIGADCDQEMMADLAKAGQGNYYFIKDASDMKETFARELGGALACEAQNIEIKIKPNNGNTVAKVLNDFTVNDDNGVATILAEDLYIGENRKVVVEMAVCKVDHPKPRKTSIAHVEIEYYDVKTKKMVQSDANVTVHFVKPDEADKEEKLEVREQVAILKVAEASLEAIELANSGDYAGAKSVFLSATSLVADAAAAGSVMCSSIQGDVDARAEMWEAGKYNQNFAGLCRSDSSNMRKMRATKGISAKMYGTQAADMMIANFNDGDDEPDPDVSVWKDPIKVTQQPRHESKKPEKKGFSKKRSGR